MNKDGSLKFFILASLNCNSFVVEHRGTKQGNGDGDEENDTAPCERELLKDLEAECTA